MITFPVSSFEVSDRHDPTNNLYSRTVTAKSYVHDDNASYCARTNGFTSMTTTYTVGKNMKPGLIVGGNSLTYSNNGINWFQSNTNISLTTINALEYNGTIYVAGGAGASDSMAYSENGTAWFSYGTPTLAVCNAIKWGGYGPRGGSMFVATGAATNGNSLAYSLGGLHLTGLGNAMFGGSLGTVNGRAIEYNGLYWLAGSSGGATYALARSITGTSEWVGIDISNITASVFDILWQGSQWIIAGQSTGNTGVIAFSTNDAATAWTVVTAPRIGTRVTGLAYNGGRIVAVGNGTGNTIAYSDDFGSTWIGLGVNLLPNTSPTSVHKVAWHQNKFIIAGTNASGTILYSSDGVSWKTTTGAGLSSCKAIISSSQQQHPLRFNLNAVICANYVSFDGGTNWNQMFNDNISVGVHNGKYAVFGAGQNGNTYVAYDLASAFKMNTSNLDASGVNALEWNGAHWLMGGKSSSLKHLLLSYDGYNWKPVATSFMTNGYAVTGIDWSPPLGRWCVSVQTGVNTNQIIYSSDGLSWSLASTVVGGGPVRWIGAYFIAAVNDSASTKIAISQDGIAWSTRLIGSYGQVLSIVADETASTLILGTYPNSTSVQAILKSTDGVNWTPVGGTNQNYRHTGAVWDGLRYLIKTDNPANSIRVSYDGITWTSVGGNLPGNQLSWTNPHVGTLTVYQPTISLGRDASNTMAFSKDGIFYKSMGNTIFSDAGNYVAWNGRLWIACGKGSLNTLAYSYDGLAWTGLGKTVFTIQTNHAVWNGSLWVATGEGGNTLAYSADGVSWTGVGSTIFDNSGLCVMWNGTSWLAGGSGSTNTLASSSNGLTWTGLSNVAMDLAVNDLQWVGVQWIMAGRATTGSNLLKYSLDGATWSTAGSQPFTTSANSVFWNGQVTVAVGEGGNTIATSADLGVTWTGQGTTVFSSRGNEVAWNDKRWIAAGMGGNTLVYSNNGTTWWPCVLPLFTEGLGVGSNPKVSPTLVRSAITLNNRDKLCVNTPRAYDSDLADDTSLVFNLNL